MRNHKNFILLVTVVLFSIGWSVAGEKTGRGLERSPSTSAGWAQEHSEFGYACETCPANWGNLSAGFGNCSTGEAQSPIAVATTQARVRHLPRLRTLYGITPLEVERLSTNFESFGEGTLRIGGKIFDFDQFHFHSKSEHFLNGEQYPLEVHLVHEASDGEIAVLGRFIKRGPVRNEELDLLLDVLPELDAHDEAFVSSFDLNALVGRDRRSYRYIGSTTTPPCASGVRWVLLASPWSISADQILTIKHTILDFNDGFDNFRPLTSLNGRIVVTDVGSGHDDEDEDEDSDD